MRTLLRMLGLIAFVIAILASGEFILAATVKLTQSFASLQHKGE